MTSAPQPIELHRDRTSAQWATRAERAGLLGSVGAVLACALVCCLPLLTAAVVAVGLGSLATGASALGVVLLVAVGAALLLSRRRHRAVGDGDGSCGCGGSCGC